MRAGRLDRIIELRHRKLSRDPDTGQEIEKWPSAYARPWAEKNDQRGREFFAAQQINGELTTSFRIRYRADVKMTDRIVYGDLTFNIHSIIELGRREGLELMATAART